jgi:hypothetical protein
MRAGTERNCRAAIPGRRFFKVAPKIDALQARKCRGSVGRSFSICAVQDDIMVDWNASRLSKLKKRCK